MNINNYNKDDIRWLVNGAMSDVVKEVLDFISQHLHNQAASPLFTSGDAVKKYEIIHNEYFKKVLKYTRNQESFYIKQYAAKTSIDVIKSLFSRSKVQREWDSNYLLLRNHIPTAEPVAVGECRHLRVLRSCYLILKAIPNCVPVRELLVDFQQSLTDGGVSKREALLKNLIFYVKTLHGCGIFHGELHAQNVLVDRGDIRRFYLVDLGRTRSKRRLPLSWRSLELSRLLFSITDICTSEEIDGMVSSYGKLMTYLSTRDNEMPPVPLLSPGEPGEVKGLSATNKTADLDNLENFRQSVNRNIYKIRRRLWNGRTGKCLTNNTVFRVTTYGRYRINMRNEWNLETLVNLINKHSHSLKERLSNIIKESPKIGITCVSMSDDCIKSVYIKEYRYPSFLKRILYSFFNSPARKAWFAAHGLLALSFLTPKPIALLEEKRMGMLKRSFIIMEDISACLPCSKYVSEQFGCSYDKATIRKKRNFISCLAKSFKQLHDSCIFHGDLKANNMLIMELRDSWDFYYLDLDRVCFNKKITPKEKIKNLAQLNASIPNYISYTDRLRFYQAYTRVKNLNRENKRILREIIQLSIQRKHAWSPKVQISRLPQANKSLCSI